MKVILAPITWVGLFAQFFIRDGVRHEFLKIAARIQYRNDWVLIFSLWKILIYILFNYQWIFISIKKGQDSSLGKTLCSPSPTDTSNLHLCGWSTEEDLRSDWRATVHRRTTQRNRYLKDGKKYPGNTIHSMICINIMEQYSWGAQAYSYPPRDRKKKKKKHFKG